MKIRLEFLKKLDMVDYIYLIGILLIPFDSLPYIFTFTVYRPVSVLFFLTYWILIRIKKPTIFKEELIFLLIIIVNIIFSFIMAVYVYNNDFRGLLDFTATSLLGFFAFSGGINFWHKVRTKVFNNDQYIIYLRTVTKVMLVFPIMIGLVQILSMLGIISKELNIQITKLFSYRTLGRRVQLVTGEPAMAARLLFVSLFILIIRKKQQKRRKREKLFILIILIELIATFSLVAYISIPFIAFLYYLYNWNWLKKIHKTIIFISIIILASIGLYKLLILYLPNNYMTLRLLRIVSYFNLNDIFKSFMKILEADGSMFIRLIHPVIGIIIFANTYLLGCGGGYYYYQYPDMINKFFPWAIKFDSVHKAVNMQELTVPKNFYAKLAAENGVFTLLFFVLSLIYIFKKLKKTPLKEIRRSNIILLFFSIIVMLITMDSWAYSHFWVLLSFFIVLIRYREAKRE